MTNQIKRHNVSSLMYEKFQGGHPSHLNLPLPSILFPAEIVLPVKIWHHTFTAYMANQIKRRNISTLTYKNFSGASQLLAITLLTRLKSEFDTDFKFGENRLQIINFLFPLFFKLSLKMMKIKTLKNPRVKRLLDKRAPKLVENRKKTLILHGTRTSSVLNSLLTEIYHLKKGEALKYSRKNENIRPFESGGETSLEFFSQKTDCSLFVFGSHSKKRPNNLVIGRTYDHHIFDLVEIGVENFKSMQTFSYDKKLAPQIGSKPFFAFVGELFESVDELKHLKEVLLDLFHGEVVTNLNLVGLDRVYVCSALSSNRILFSHCALRLKRSGTIVPRIELVEVGPSMDMVVRRHRLPADGLRKEAMKTAPEAKKKKEKNVRKDAIQGKIGKIYIPDQKVGSVPFANKAKGVKRERREAKTKNEGSQPGKKHKSE
ncbi:ribosome production factor 2 [Dorcoceras hygrometricum]|uniref:Ribosome production factor 2 homolog n=1 Tax=Dorcoceras hygrometricum TaxID=472368 RepID=A0A2Z7AAR5_9LAMI|nr:ribosome production factor 2 [Dorcoceras hygrometricum]